MGIKEDFSEWSGMPLDAIQKNIDVCHELSKNDFQTFKNETEFYKQSKTYIFDIMTVGNSPTDVEEKLEKFMPGICGVLRNSIGKFLDFGGGTGLMCEWVATNTNLEVTYFDLEGYLSKFADWRFKKHNLSIELVYGQATDFNLPKKYNIIFTDAVWEHLDPSMQLRYAEKLSNYISEGGMFLQIIDLCGASPDMPMHYDVDIVKVHNTLAKKLTCVAGRNNFASIWTRPVKPRTISTTISSDLGFEKEFKAVGLGAATYTTVETARGNTYTTKTDGFPPTPFISPINPFNEEILASKNVLEIGCGVGRNLPFVMEQTTANYYGVDPNESMTQYFWDVQDNKYKPRVTLCKTFDDLPKDIKFDFVIVTFVFMHIGFRPSSLQMNVADITREAMKHTQPGTIWFLLEHEREEVWQQRWLDELNIIPAVYFKPGGNHAGGGIIPYPEFEVMTHRGNDHNIIIFKE